jgi:hypothetical protein
VASCEKDATSGLSLPDDVTSSRCRQNAVLADQKLLDPVRSSNLGNQLDDLGVVEPSIAGDDQFSA